MIDDYEWAAIEHTAAVFHHQHHHISMDRAFCKEPVDAILIKFMLKLVFT